MSDKPYGMERIIAGLSYLTSGFVGFIWFLIAIFTKSKIRPFLQFHIFQSILLAMAYYLVSILVSWVLNILSFIPFINVLILKIVYYLNAPAIFGYSLIQTIVYVVLFYLALMAFRGRYGYFPFISEIVKGNVNR